MKSILGVLTSIVTKKELIGIVCCLSTTTVATAGVVGYKVLSPPSKVAEVTSVKTDEVIGLTEDSTDMETVYAEADKAMAEYDYMKSEMVIEQHTGNFELDELNRQINFSKFTNVENSEKTIVNDIDKVISEDINVSHRDNFDPDRVMCADDIAGWLYVPGTEIDYVVMRGDSEDSDKYLWKDPYGNPSNTGSLYVRYNGDDPEQDCHMVIYGHRLKDHKLYFGSLFDYRSEDFARSHDKAYFYTEDKSVMYKLCSINEGLNTDMVYSFPFMNSTDEYQLLLDACNETAVNTLQDLDPTKDMLVLSTCSGDHSGMPDRLYLIFQKEAVYDR